MIEVPESSVPVGAKFGVRVRGNSMEPIYRDDQLVWVQLCEELRSGEVGFFLYDGSGYVKAYDEQEPDDEEAFIGRGEKDAACPHLLQPGLCADLRPLLRSRGAC